MTQVNLKSALIWFWLILLTIAIYLGISVYYKTHGVGAVNSAVEGVESPWSNRSVPDNPDSLPTSSEVTSAVPVPQVESSETIKRITTTSRKAPEPEVEKVLALVERHISTFTVTQADFESLQKILAKDPNNYFAHFLLARCFQRCGLEDMAVEQIQLAEKLAVNPEDLLRRLKHHIEAGEFAEAFSMKQFVFDKAPTDPSLLLLHGLFYLEHGAVPGAEAVFQKLLIRPDCPLGAATALGTIRMDQHKFREASALADKDLKLNPSYMSALLLKSQSMLAFGDARGVISLLQKPLEEHPFNRRLNLLLYQAYKHEGMNEEALARALTVMAGSDFISFFEPAMKQVRELLKVLPRNVSDRIVRDTGKEIDRTDYAMKFHFYLGWCYYDLNKTAEAIRETQRALDLDSEFQPNWYQMGLIREKLLGDLPGALVYYEKAHTLQHSDNKAVVAIKRVKYRLRNANSDIARKLKNALHLNHAGLAPR